MVTSIYLLRHGETAWSLTGQHTGRTDLPLTENGERRAARLRERLREITFTQVFTSPLQRARQTCERAGFGPVARVEPDLREWDYGDYEGLTTAEIRVQKPGWDVFQDGGLHGESVEQIRQRADRMLAVIRPLNGTVAVFSHGHFLRALAMRWLGLPVQEGRHFTLDTGAVSILGYEHPDQATAVVALWNSASAAV